MLYPALVDRTYLNYGGQGVLSQLTLEAITQAFWRVEQQGCFSWQNNHWLREMTHATKAVIAQELGVTPETITLTENTTMGCNIALWSIDWQRGDRLLLSDGEHPGIVAITAELQRRYGIEIDILPVGAVWQDSAILEHLRERLTDRTRMVCLSHIIWNTGQIMPLKEICQLCHQRGIFVAVDAAQSVGVLPLNLTDLEVDFYAFTAHKWWCAPLGVGGLYVRPDIWSAIHSTYIGWRGLEGSDRGAKFEVATSAYPLYVGLQTALLCANQWGNAQQRYDRLCLLAQHLWQELQKLPHVNCLQPQPPQCGLVTFSIPDRPASAVSQWLETEHRIYLRAMPEPKCLRASIHYLTTEKDLDYLIDVLKLACPGC